MLIEKLYWVSTWTETVKTVSRRRGGEASASEHAAFERRMRKLHNQTFFRNPCAA